MLRKTLTYDGFDGPITEDWYFHLNEAELTKMQLEHGEGLEEHLKTLVKNNDARAIIVGSYGESPLKSAILGSTPHRLLHDAHRPVLVVPVASGG